MSAPSSTCTHHPLREAVGICVRCQSALCSDCITKLDGINHCRRCLEALPHKMRSQTRPRRFRVPGWLALSAGMSAVTLLAWLMLEVLMPGKSAP